jgi:hypothetical protein
MSTRKHDLLEAGTLPVAEPNHRAEPNLGADPVAVAEPNVGADTLSVAAPEPHAGADLVVSATESDGAGAAGVRIDELLEHPAARRRAP